MVDDDEFAHEAKESSGVGVRVTCRDEVAISQIQPDLDVVLSPFLPIIGLKVVNDGNVVDILATRGDISMPIVTILLLKLGNKILHYTENARY